MPRRGSLTLRGDKALARMLGKLGKQAGPISVEVAKEWADDVQATAKANVPVLSGELQAAIDTRIAGTSAEVGVWTVIYAFWTEVGNSRQKAQPYLLPAFDAHRNIRPYARAALEKRTPL